MTCKDAAELLSQREEKKLSFLKILKLRFHLLGCDVCALFTKQWNVLTYNIKHDDCEHCLSDAEKEKMKMALSEVTVSQ